MLGNPPRPPNEKVIWRYLSLDKYLDLLLTKTIKFTQVEIAADQLEISLMLKRLEQNGSLDGKGNILESASYFINILRKSYYISCWTGKEHECRSLWFSYLGESRLGVVIKSTVGQVKEHIVWGDYGFDYNEVIYRDTFDDTEELQSHIKLLNSKALAYSSESEVRFSVNESLMYLPEGELSATNPPVKIDPNSLPKIISFNSNLQSMINEVWISPYCQEWQLEMLKNLTANLAPYLVDKMKSSDLNERI
ncbi:hypothetical protein [Colwellia echini]|uniref:DUF2971 domain-containing protein n=1 Tax=Colwellia echini TaxID=1982103 RepID=A0ABY3MSN6_9GAMM|nr:hypothetical protein [Colwellia echini]TYK64200.1 hypothetical protein CWS31_016885 [Colwellia echini]